MRKFILNPLLFSLFFCFLLSYTTKATPNDTLIAELPGFNGTFPSKHYSGYITIDQKNLFYYFVASERKPSEDPVVLWLNGGPGCSSFDGFVYEHGPFNFEASKTNKDLPKLHLNPSSWSKVSNIIYLDSPAGVGFSYSKNPKDYRTGDKQTAIDTHTFLLKWFEQYPEFQSNPLYLSGESFAGIYIPTLASEVVKGIDNHIKPVLNFKGYMIGNGVTDPVFDGNALVPFTHGMGLISDELFENVTAACNGNFAKNKTPSCSKLLWEVDTVVSSLNVYDILEPCHHNPETEETVTKNTKLPSSFKNLGKTDKPHPVRKRMFGRAWPYNAPVTDGIVPTWPQISSHEFSVPCIDDSVASIWLNRKDVKNSIHVSQVNGQEITWGLCTSKISYNHDLGSMIPYHKNLTARGYRALIFSGDHDMCVPFTGSQAWTRSLGYKVLDKWRAWFYNEQVAGFIQGYEKNLTFLTIKGAGHTVPEYKPKESLAFYSRWLEGKAI